jgi:hypothetical protein
LLELCSDRVGAKLLLWCPWWRVWLKQHTSMIEKHTFSYHGRLRPHWYHGSMDSRGHDKRRCVFLSLRCVALARPLDELWPWGDQLDVLLANFGEAVCKRKDKCWTMES